MCLYGIRCGGWKPELLEMMKAERATAVSVAKKLTKPELVAYVAGLPGKNDPAYYERLTKKALTTIAVAEHVDAVAEKLGAYDRPRCAS